MIKQLLDIFSKQQMSIKMLKRSKSMRFLLSSVLVLIIVGAFSTILIPVYLHADELTSMLSGINIGGIVLTLCFAMVFIISFISGLGFLYSGGYLDNNLNNYFVLPIKRRELILAKVIFTYKNVMVIVGMICIPFIILYLLLANVTIYFIVALVLGILLIPLFNIGICMVLIGTLMFFVNKVKNKALAKNLIYVTFFVVAFGLYMVFILGTTNYGNADSQFAAIVALQDLMKKLKIIFFIPNMFVGILTYESFFNLLYIIGGIIILGITYLYFEKVYLKGALGFNEGGSSSRRKKRKTGTVSNHSMSTWYFIREFKELTKTSAYFFNTLFSNILIVVMYLGMMGFIYFNSSIDKSMIDSMISNLDPYYVIMGTACIGTFFALFNMGAATAFSRDAKYLDFISAMPINQVKAFLGKVAFHALVEFLTLFIFMIIPMLILQVDAILIIISILVMLLIVCGTLFIPIIIDLNFPSLDWESETALVKRGKSLIISMIASLILDVVFFGGSALLIFGLDVEYEVVAIIMVVFYIVLFIVLFMIYRKSVVKAFKKIKV